MSVVFIKLYEWLYNKIALCLQDLENERLKDDRDNGLIFKVYLFAFINNFFMLSYNALIQNKWSFIYRQILSVMLTKNLIPNIVYKFVNRI